MNCDTGLTSRRGRVDASALTPAPRSGLQKPRWASSARADDAGGRARETAQLDVQFDAQFVAQRSAPCAPQHSAQSARQQYAAQYGAQQSVCVSVLDAARAAVRAAIRSAVRSAVRNATCAAVRGERAAAPQHAQEYGAPYGAQYGGQYAPQQPQPYAPQHAPPSAPQHAPPSAPLSTYGELQEFGSAGAEAGRGAAPWAAPQRGVARVAVNAPFAPPGAASGSGPAGQDRAPRRDASRPSAQSASGHGGRGFGSVADRGSADAQWLHSGGAPPRTQPPSRAFDPQKPAQPEVGWQIPQPDFAAPSPSTFAAAPTVTPMAPGSEDAEEDDLPLLQELGIYPLQLLSNVVRVVLLRSLEKARLEDIDMTAPIAIVVAVSSLLLLAGKIQFGMIYALMSFGTICMCCILNLFSATVRVSIYQTLSVLGYGLLPMILLAAVHVVRDFENPLSYALVATAVGWCSLIGAKMYCDLCALQNQRLLIWYPLFLFYLAFSLITLF